MRVSFSPHASHMMGLTGISGQDVKYVLDHYDDMGYVKNGDPIYTGSTPNQRRLAVAVQESESRDELTVVSAWFV